MDIDSLPDSRVVEMYRINLVRKRLFAPVAGVAAVRQRQKKKA